MRIPAQTNYVLSTFKQKTTQWRRLRLKPDTGYERKVPDWEDKSLNIPSSGKLMRWRPKRPQERKLACKQIKFFFFLKKAKDTKKERKKVRGSSQALWEQEGLQQASRTKGMNTGLLTSPERQPDVSWMQSSSNAFKGTVIPTAKPLYRETSNSKDDKVSGQTKQMRIVSKMLGVTASIILQHFVFRQFLGCCHADLKGRSATLCWTEWLDSGTYTKEPLHLIWSNKTNTPAIRCIFVLMRDTWGVNEQCCKMSTMIAFPC